MTLQQALAQAGGCFDMAVSSFALGLSRLLVQQLKQDKVWEVDDIPGQAPLQQNQLILSDLLSSQPLPLSSTSTGEQAMKPTVDFLSRSNSRQGG